MFMLYSVFVYVIKFGRNGPLRFRKDGILVKEIIVNYYSQLVLTDC
jgi:hypothetical protein